MKVTIDLEMTPAEMREVLGLPDVKGAQDRWVQQLEEKLQQEITKLSPENIAKQWAGALAPNPDVLSALIQMFPGAKSDK